jgi:hypothetical protein
MGAKVLHTNVILIHTIHKGYICMKCNKYSCLLFVQLYALVIIYFFGSLLNSLHIYQVMMSFLNCIFNRIYNFGMHHEVTTKIEIQFILHLVWHSVLFIKRKLNA